MYETKATVIFITEKPIVGNGLICPIIDKNVILIAIQSVEPSKEREKTKNCFGEIS